MAYKDDYYQEVDNILDGMRKDNPYELGNDLNSVRQEDQGQIQPVGWVENADGTDGEAKVLINADGITIYDGKLVFEDEFGNTVLSGAGFSSNWLDFLSGRIYNGNFIAGTLNAITAATIVGSATTIADYEASLSADLPYWIIESITIGSGGSLQRVVDADAIGGYALRWSGDIVATIMQDIPVTPGESMAIFLTWKYTNSSSEFSDRIGLQYMDSTHAPIGTETAAGLSYTTSQSAYASDYGYSHFRAPSNARFLRLKYRISRTSGSPVVTLASIAASETSHYGNLTLYGDVPHLKFDEDGTIFFGSELDSPTISGSTSADLVTLSTADAVSQAAFHIARGWLDLGEIATPAAPSANKGRLYVVDNGAGKSSLRVLFPNGSVVTLATET